MISNIHSSTICNLFVKSRSTVLEMEPQYMGSFAWITKVCFNARNLKAVLSEEKHTSPKDVHKCNLCNFVNLILPHGLLPLAIVGACPPPPPQVFLLALLTQWQDITFYSINFFFLDSIYIVLVICMYDKSKKEYMERICSNFRRVVILGRKGKERQGLGGVLTISGMFYFS